MSIANGIIVMNQGECTDSHSFLILHVKLIVNILHITIISIYIYIYNYIKLYSCRVSSFIVYNNIVLFEFYFTSQHPQSRRTIP